MEGKGVIARMLKEEQAARLVESEKRDEYSEILKLHDDLCKMKEEMYRMKRDEGMSNIIVRNELRDLIASSDRIYDFLSEITDRKNRILSFLQKSRSYGEIKIENQFHRDLYEVIPLLVDTIQTFEENGEVLREYGAIELDMERARVLHSRAEEQIAKMNRQCEQLLLVSQKFDDVF